MCVSHRYKKKELQRALLSVYEKIPVLEASELNRDPPVSTYIIGKT